ncbi:MAG: mannose-1-phosphate guanylyltransferase [Pirellulaceae bacterium]
MLYATIMAGGSGTRFWPASRRARPKQLLSLVGESSMLQSTVARLNGLCPDEQILILTNQQLVDATRSQLPTLPTSSIIGEPCKRDTAPCIGLAAGLIARRQPDATMLVMPADHVIQQVDQFHAAVAQAEKLLDEDPSRIITFGVRPTYPATVFGYIQRGESIGQGWHVSKFREKPDRETAETWVESGEYYWNAGIFVWRVSTILAALESLEPEMFAHLKTITDAADSNNFDDVFSREFTAINGKSIDYAVMEHHENVCVIEAPFDWDDVGNWTAVPRLSGVDEAGNAASGKQLCIDTRDSIVRSTDDHLVVTLGLRDCIVIHTTDATLVADKNDEAAIKKVVQQLEDRGMDEFL